jgi:hypothetical protein
LDGSRDIASIVNSIQESFEDVPENEVEEHTRAFITDMRASDFVQET